MSIELQPRIVVFGVGGAGGNAVDNMIKAELQGVEFVVANTDAQALSRSSCENRIQLGLETTSGLGAGARPEVGTAAAEESLEEIDLHLEGAHMVFIAAGMGGGTGTGSAPVIARAARDRGILTVGVVTKPFGFEGKRRMSLAEQGLAEIKKHVDTLIIIPNQNLFRVANEQTTFADAFQMADRVLYSGVRGITDLMVMPGLINLDFADVRTVMAEMGSAMMGTGEGTGEGRAMEAAQQAVANPLLDDISLKGAKGVLINITGGYDMTLYEVDEAANEIRNQVDPDANIILGSTFDDSIEGKMRVSVVATGIDTEVSTAPKAKADDNVSSFASGLAQKHTGHKPAVVQTVTPEPEVEVEVESPKPVVTEAEPAPKPRPVPVSEAQPTGSDRVSVDDVFGNTNMGAPPPRTDINPDPGQRTGLHNLFGWRRPTGDDADAPFEDVETTAASNEDKEEIMPPMNEDTDLEIPAFLRRSANH
ncbi:MAG: cell division protein FtsZ [Ponticaulis sp.]|nr:cell division protein FtsZ [Ponticaulis sp.]|tara:strand:- start:13399 stop:14832 length:1434 start_codon:yes stop_codon:yes gene_type:complete